MFYSSRWKYILYNKIILNKNKMLVKKLIVFLFLILLFPAKMIKRPLFLVLMKQLIL